MHAWVRGGGGGGGMPGSAEGTVGTVVVSEAGCLHQWTK